MAFGDNPFGGHGPGQRGRGGGGGGGGKNRNKNRNRNKNKNRNRNKNNRGGGGGGGGAIIDDPFDDGEAGSGNPFENLPDIGGGDPGGPGSIFTGEGSESSGDTENYKGAAWGLLNAAGISSNAMTGSLQSEWLDRQIDDWYNNQWQGQGNIAGSDAMPWDQFLYALPGDLSGASDPQPLIPITRPGQPSPIHVAGGGTLPDWAGGGPLPDWAQKPPKPPKPGTHDWVTEDWGPAMRQYLTARYQASSPRQRGVDTRDWVAPRRTVQF